MWGRLVASLQNTKKLEVKKELVLQDLNLQRIFNLLSLPYEWGQVFSDVTQTNSNFLQNRRIES